MEYNAIVVFTSKNLEDIFDEGGSGWWIISKDRAKNIKYVVCTQNQNGICTDNSKTYANDHCAFLVGKVTDVIESSDENGKKRQLLKFSEYAEIQGDVYKWPGFRNPVYYTNLNDVSINIQDLKFEPMPETEDLKEISLNDAKRRLAFTLGVPLSSISISINI